MPRQRSSSITPTFSNDRALLLSHKPSAIASNVEEARSTLSLLGISQDSAFQRRAGLESVKEWTEFLESCTEETDKTINLEAALKKCYSIAYSMPPSPLSQQRTTVRDSPEPLTV